MKASEKEKCRARYFVAKLAYSAGIATLEQAENAPSSSEWLRTLLKYDSEATRHTALGGFSFPVDYNYELEEWPSLQGCTKEERAEVHGLQEKYRAKFRDFVLRVERCFPAYAGRVEELSICLERFEQDTGAWIFEKQWFSPRWGDMEGERRQKAEERWKKIEADFRVLFAEIANSDSNPTQAAPICQQQPDARPAQSARQSDRCEVVPDENSEAGAIYAEWQRFKNGRASDFSDESGRNVRKVGQKRTMREFYDAKKDKPLSARFPDHLKTYTNNSFAEFKRIVERVRKAIERERKK